MVEEQKTVTYDEVIPLRLVCLGTISLLSELSFHFKMNLSKVCQSAIHNLPNTLLQYGNFLITNRTPTSTANSQLGQGPSPFTPVSVARV